MNTRDTGKRQRLIDSAYKEFSTKGFNNTSIKDIAKNANITPGLVHYYFKNKEELLFSVQNDIQTKYHSKYGTEESSQINPSEVLLEIKSRVENDPLWYLWRYELYSLGLKGETYQKEVMNILQNGRESLSKPLQKLTNNPSKANALASILLACFDGLALQKIIDKEFDIDKTYDLLIEISNGLLKDE
ncbi:TetR/AcrR family transcriptional regulator [Halalkalibacter sp. APA_J-10(15)]|uniref:TetR/AcrR family transcriptional regulator n=1 Tax=Halalkalibacter sp. APA_J-10(15) TaxID=2933805 RepID=UPI001FF15126|nr:TetR/AcrR family transcriptional regulator [Halalkalibacter sp. APA_J-10(15)]MCK0470418.1 TetR/AcrR family transcriptional regulator [Halalkalibacter sp. APA_J-10(15)]